MRRLLFKQNPHCHWCNVLTVLVPDHMVTPAQLLNMATVDHVKSRCEARTREEWSAPSNQVLACHQCNQRRNREFLAANPGARPLFALRKQNQKMVKRAQRRAAVSPLPSRDSEPIACCPYYHTHY